MSKVPFFFLTFLIVFAAVHAALAADTYYDILKRRYASNSIPIALSDIDVPGYPFARICIEIEEEKPLTQNYIMIHKYKRILEGQGPLLPRVEMVKVLYRSYAGSAFDDQTFDNTQMEYSSKEIKSTLIDLQGKKQWVLNVKKQDNDILIFRRDVFVEPTKTLYGYCYRRDSAKKGLK